MENHQSLEHDEILSFNKLLTVDHYAFCMTAIVLVYTIVWFILFSNQVMLQSTQCSLNKTNNNFAVFNLFKQRA